MDNVSVTSKGQVTIPKKVRTALGITAGTKVTFATEGNSARLMVVRTRKPSRVEAGPKILDYKGKAATLDEMEEAIARGAARKARRNPAPCDGAGGMSVILSSAREVHRRRPRASQ